MRNTRLDETRAAIKITGRNIHDLRYADNIVVILLCVKYSAHISLS